MSEGYIHTNYYARLMFAVTDNCYLDVGEYFGVAGHSLWASLGEVRAEGHMQLHTPQIRTTLYSNAISIIRTSPV